MLPLFVNWGEEFGLGSWLNDRAYIIDLCQLFSVNIFDYLFSDYNRYEDVQDPRWRHIKSCLFKWKTLLVMLHVVDEKQTNKTLNHVINLSQTYILQKNFKSDWTEN